MTKNLLLACLLLFLAGCGGLPPVEQDSTPDSHPMIMPIEAGIYAPAGDCEEPK